MKHCLQIAVLLFSCSATFCQPGSIDKNFGQQGKAITPFNAQAVLHALALQADGKIIAAGTGDGIAFTLVRYNANGTPDNTFGNGSIVRTIISSYSAANAVAVQRDGKIVAAGFSGTGTYPNSTSNVSVVRYNTDGTPDNSFGNGGIAATDIAKYDYGNAIALQSDGKIVVAGYTSNGTDEDILVLRLNANGSLDNSFGKGGKVITGYDDNGYAVTDEASAVALQTDGKIVIGGVTSDDLGNSVNAALIRYNTNGTLDNTFGVGGKLPLFTGVAWARSLAIQNDGSVIVAGNTINDDYNNVPVLAKYLPAGLPDKSYGDDGIAYVTGYYQSYAGQMYSVALQPDGKAVSAGENTNGKPVAAVVRYTGTGKRDATFGVNGLVASSSGQLLTFESGPLYPILLQPDGKIVTGSTYGVSFQHKNFLVTRLLGDDAEKENNKGMMVQNKLSASIYPNPVSSTLFIKGLNPLQPASITITDVSGNIKKQVQITGNQPAVTVSFLQPGRYIAVIRQGGNVVSLSFIRQ